MPNMDNDKWITKTGNPPEYVLKMKLILEECWSKPDGQLAKDLAKDATEVFKREEYKLLAVDSDKKVVAHFDTPALFNLVIPMKPAAKATPAETDAHRTLVAKHVIRCCMEC